MEVLGFHPCLSFYFFFVLLSASGHRAGLYIIQAATAAAKGRFQVQPQYLKALSLYIAFHTLPIGAEANIIEAVLPLYGEVVKLCVIHPKLVKSSAEREFIVMVHRLISFLTLGRDKPFQVGLLLSWPKNNSEL